jgi:hypothetical protein
MWTTHLHLVESLRMNGAKLLLPLYALMAWAVTTLPFTSRMLRTFWIYVTKMLYLEAKCTDMCWKFANKVRKVGSLVLLTWLGCIHVHRYGLYCKDHRSILHQVLQSGSSFSVSGINSANTRTWSGFSLDNLTTLVPVTHYNSKAVYLAIPSLHHNYLRLCVTFPTPYGERQSVDRNINLLC